MNKKLLHLILLYLATQPFMQSAMPPKTPKGQPVNPIALATQALELASILKTPIELAFGEIPFGMYAPEYTEEHLPINEQITLLQNKLAKITNKGFNSTINKEIKDLRAALNAKDNAAFKNIMQQMYPRFIIKSTNTRHFLGKKNPKFLKINLDSNIFAHFNKLDQSNKTAIIQDILNIVSLLWLEYIKTFNNMPVAIKFDLGDGKLQTLTISPLKWANRTSFAGAKGLNTKNNIFKYYSKSIIENIFTSVTKKAGDILKKIDRKSKNEDLTDIEKQTFADEVYAELSTLYALLFQPKQEQNTFFKLKPEFQEAFPLLPRMAGLLAPELTKEFATTLTILASVWLKLIDTMIITDTTIAQLTYPQILDLQKQAIGIQAQEWMHYTAYAGYDSLCDNKQYEDLLRDHPHKGSYLEWLKNFPRKVKNAFTAAKNLFADKEEDDDDSDIENN